MASVGTLYKKWTVVSKSWTHKDNKQHFLSELFKEVPHNREKCRCVLENGLFYINEIEWKGSSLLC